jgi:hypothetical protein
MSVKTPWLKNAAFDLPLILLPSLFSVLVAAIFADGWGPEYKMPLWAWLVFVLGIDVAHVYSTLFRTYFNSHEFRENKLLLTLIPLGAWLVGVVLYWMDDSFFWRILAYVAVFHFIRQQYGFLRLYSRFETQTWIERRLDAGVIYLATLYPILFWHAHQPRSFHWFVDGDFVSGIPVWISSAAGWIYCAVLVSYIANEIHQTTRGRSFNLPKNLVILGTAISWYFGIVYFNGDMIFTITNVVSHGIPYMALVWLYGERQKSRSDAPLIAGRFSYGLFFSRFSVPLFFGLLLLFGFVEEGLWANLVWREHLQVFGLFSSLPSITSKDTLSWLVPLLTLPQATHYVLDGFIWKLKDSEANWQKVLFPGRTSF